MQSRFFAIPARGEESAEGALNQFLAVHRIISLDRQFVQDGQSSFWAVCVTYLATGDKPQVGAARDRTDYRAVLSEADFAIYAKLRLLRKQLADRDGVPAYAVFTNDQMAAMVQTKAATAAALREIAGVGAARADKYGAEFLAALVGDRTDGPDQHEAQ